MNRDEAEQNLFARALTVARTMELAAARIREACEARSLRRLGECRDLRNDNQNTVAAEADMLWMLTR